MVSTEVRRKVEVKKSEEEEEKKKKRGGKRQEGSNSQPEGRWTRERAATEEAMSIRH